MSSTTSFQIRILFLSGIVASLLYVAMNIFIPLKWPEYSSLSQTVSELSAIDAPTRPIWFPLGIVYAALMLLFATGIFQSAGENKKLRITAIFLALYSLLSFFWPPMHLREVLAAGGKTLTDTMHIVFAMVTVFLMVMSMAFGAASLGKNFKYYSIFTIVILAFFGLLTSRESPGVEMNLPTPYIGLWERINIGVFLLWIMVLSVHLIRKQQRIT